MIVSLLSRSLSEVVNNYELMWHFISYGSGFELLLNRKQGKGSNEELAIVIQGVVMDNNAIQLLNRYQVNLTKQTIYTIRWMVLFLVDTVIYP